MTTLDSVLDRGQTDESVSAGEPTAASHRERLISMTEENFQFIWRSLRRLGIADGAVDDAAQKVFEIAVKKLDRIAPGSERAFLFNTAIRVAAGARRHAATRRETFDEELMLRHVDPGPQPDEAAEWRRRRALLDEVLSDMPLRLRTVFVLFELEGMSTPQIAELLSIPVGTAASRLRKAREVFEHLVRRLRARRDFAGGAR